MNTREKVAWVVAVVAIVAAALMWFAKPSSPAFGAIGSMLAENYIPYIRYNEGFNTEKDIVTTADLETSGTFTMSGTGTISGATTLSSTTATTLKVGQLGTGHTQILSGTCNLTSNSSIAASSTGTGTCTISNLAHGDKVFLQLASTSNTTVLRNVLVTDASVNGGATGVIADLYNQTGAAVVPAANLNWGSSTQYLIVR